LDQLCDIPAGAKQDVIDDLLGWRNLPVAIMPCSLGDFEQIKNRISIGVTKNGDDTRPSFIPALGPTNSHFLIP
jgi:hypothetical protein